MFAGLYHSPHSVQYARSGSIPALRMSRCNCFQVVPFLRFRPNHHSIKPTTTLLLSSGPTIGTNSPGQSARRTPMHTGGEFVPKIGRPESKTTGGSSHGAECTQTRNRHGAALNPRNAFRRSHGTHLPIFGTYCAHRPLRAGLRIRVYVPRDHRALVLFGCRCRRGGRSTSFYPSCRYRGSGRYTFPDVTYVTPLKLTQRRASRWAPATRQPRSRPA